MRKLLTTSALLLALSCPAFAGEIPTPGSPTPPPPQSTSTVQETTDDTTLDGIMHTPGVSESLAEVALDLMAVLPSLF